MALLAGFGVLAQREFILNEREAGLNVVAEEIRPDLTVNRSIRKRGNVATGYHYRPVESDIAQDFGLEDKQEGVTVGLDDHGCFVRSRR